MGTRSPSRSGASTRCRASPCGDVSHLPSPCFAIRPGPQCLGCCNGGFISPASRSDTGSALGHGKCSTQAGSTPPHPCMSRPRGPTSFVSVSAFTTVPGLCSHLPYSAAYMWACSVVALAPALLAAYTLAPSPSHIAITSPCLSNATSRVAVAAAANICHYHLHHHHYHHHNTVATNTKSAMLRRSQPTVHYMMTCLRKCLCSCSNGTALSSRCARVHHIHMQHQRCHRRPWASLGTCQCCQAHQQGVSYGRGPSGPVVSLIRREAEAAVIGDLAAAGSIPAIGKKWPTPHALMGNPPSQDNGFPARKGLP